MRFCICLAQAFTTEKIPQLVSYGSYRGAAVLLIPEKSTFIVGTDIRQAAI
jgi:hypothetical protein